MNAPAGEVPDQPGVDRAESQFAAFGPRPCACDMVENPTQLRPGEVGIEQQAGAPLHLSLDARGLQLRAEIRGAPVLPHNRVVDWLARPAVPNDGCLSLVGDAESRDPAGRQTRFSQGLDGHRNLGSPDLARIVLHPTGLRIELREFPLGEAHNGGIIAENNRA